MSTLILTRRIGERIMIGDDIVLTVLDADESAESAKLGTRAPRDVTIQRQEEAPWPASGPPSPHWVRPRDPSVGWLVLERNVGEHIRIGHDIRLTVVGFDHAGEVRLGTQAPAAVAVHREEIYRKIEQQKLSAAPQTTAAEPLVVYRRRRVPTDAS